MLVGMDPPARRSLLAAVALALAWGLGLALPALWRGELLGHGWTDLYPSVWGLWGFARTWPALPDHTDLLGFPGGMGFYYSSPLKGWIAGALLPLLSLPATWNLLTVLARVGTVLAAWAAGRAWGLGGPGALVAASAFGCAPFFHGYAVEGIVEGTDGWTLALLLWALGRRRVVLAAPLLTLTILSSWYLGAAGCLLTLMASIRDRRALGSLVVGLALSAPALAQFADAFSGGEPLPDEIRAAMGAPLTPRPPGALPGLQPFALSTWIGLSLGACALASARRHPRLAALALLPAVLSLGAGPWYDLPVLEALRFPYRWHAATLALLALLAGRVADRRGWLWLGPLIALEGVLFSPIEPILPGASAEIPDIYADIDGPVLDLPGPVGLPPGQINPSRPRSRFLLYFQTGHGQPSPWVPDFNSVGVSAASPLVEPFRGWDRVEVAGNGLAPADRLPPSTVADLGRAGVTHVVLHRAELGDRASRLLGAALIAQGADPIADDGARWLFALPR